MASSMQRRIQQLEEQAHKGGNEKSGGLSRAAATLVVDITHMDEDLSSDEREAAIQEQMKPKPGPPPSPEWLQKLKEVVQSMVSDDGKPFDQAMAELRALDSQ
ncbi:MAG: hypothetical protein ACQERT_11565 [Thermodesulfobacteriota bacterium]